MHQCLDHWDGQPHAGIANRAAAAALARLEGTRMTSAGMASHTNHSKLIAEDPIPVDLLAARREIERQDRAFVDQRRAAILAGTEPAHGVLGYVQRPRN